MNKRISIAIGGGLLGVLLMVAIAATVDPAIAHFPGLTLNGQTNVISDNGTALTRDGVAIGGGGSAIAGTVINTGASTANAVPVYTGTDRTNVQPSTVTISSGNIIANSYTAGTTNLVGELASKAPSTSPTLVTPIIGVATGTRLGLGAAADAAAPLTVERDSLGTTPSPGLQLTNTTAAANGAQQYSPSLYWSGNGWGTAGGASQPVLFRSYVLPFQAANASARLQFDSSLNGGAFGNVVYIDSNGNINAANNISAGVALTAATAITAGSANGFVLASKSKIVSAVDGSLTLENNAATSFTSLRLGPDSATASNVEIRPGDGSGTDKTGGNLTHSGGIGTGAGAGGDIIEKTSIMSTNGITAQTQTTRRYVRAKPTTLTESSATLVANVTLAALKHTSIKVFASTHANDGTDTQDRTDEMTITAVNKAGTLTFSSDAVNGVDLIYSHAANSTGTLTTTWTAVANGASIDIKCNAVSSLTQTTLQTLWILEINSNDPATVTPN